MVGIARSRRTARRRKRALWAAALCSASFLTSHVLFGDDQPASPAAAPSLLSQYLDAKTDVVTPPIENDPAATRRSKPVVIAAESPAEPAAPPTIEPIKIAPRTVETLPSASLRSIAVSAANDLPFIPAQPLPPTSQPATSQPATSQPATSNVQPALAEASLTAKPAVAQTSVVVGTGKPLENPHAKTAAASSPAQPTDDENLPPIVPAWAVPRPGTKKKPSAAPVLNQSIQNPKPKIENPAPPPLRIELGGDSTPSPATLPQAAPPAAAPNRRAESSLPQSLPQVIEPTPRASDFQRVTAARSSTMREPSLLPPARAVQPMPLEIRNPHVSHASPASFEMPLAWPSTAPQHVDDTTAAR